VQFKALKQDVLLQMFESGLEDDNIFPSSGNLFAIGNRTGNFVCGCQNGMSAKLLSANQRNDIRED
jgi:hypothetical protein